MTALACVLPWVSLALTPIVIAMSVTCAVMARRLRRATDQMNRVTQHAVLLTTSIVSHTAPWLECERCGARLDTHGGVGVALDGHGQLRLRCADHMNEDL